MIKILETVFDRHPDVDPSEIVSAWNVRLRTQAKSNENGAYLFATGIAKTGRFIEMCAFNDAGDTVVFFASPISPDSLMTNSIFS